MAVRVDRDQCNGDYFMENWPEQSDFQGLGPGNVHIIMESDEEHCRGRGDEAVNLYDAMKGTVAGFGFCQDMIQEKVLLKQTFHALAL